jgi:hypothetical protein
MLWHYVDERTNERRAIDHLRGLVRQAGASED